MASISSQFHAASPSPDKVQIAYTFHLLAVAAPFALRQKLKQRGNTAFAQFDF